MIPQQGYNGLKTKDSVYILNNLNWWKNYCVLRNNHLEKHVRYFVKNFMYLCNKSEDISDEAQDMEGCEGMLGDGIFLVFTRINIELLYIFSAI